MKYKIIDDALSQKDLLALQKAMMWSADFPWYLCDEILIGQPFDGFYATHLFYYIGVPPTLRGPDISSFNPILQPLVDVLKPNSIIRIKANFYPRTSEILEHDPHVDFDYLHKGALFYLNSCDGYTRLDDGTKIESIENRLLFLDASKVHRSTTCTNAKGRFNINFNYF